MAEALRSAKVQSELAHTISPFLDGAELVGMPAILGLQRSAAVAANLEGLLGVPVFEIATMPPSVPGLRLKQAIEQEVLRGGAVLFSNRRASRVDTSAPRCVRVVLEAGQSQEIVGASGVVLATGRFLGGGLTAGREGIRETLLDLPVHQPETRQDWHRHHFLDSRGHPANRAGLEVDDLFRPLGSNGKAAYENVFAAGSVLAHQDWKRMKCGAGLAISSAYGAVKSFIHASG
jgi:glycerol-3-phosphate dehydrogenase subunit B